MLWEHQYTEIEAVHLTIRVIQSSHFKAFQGTVLMAVLLYFGILDSKPFHHIGEMAKVANHSMSVESTLYFDYHE